MSSDKTKAFIKAVALWVLLIGAGVLVIYWGTQAFSRSLERTMVEISEGQARTELSGSALAIASVRSYYT
jgi:hypothetical protein